MDQKIIILLYDYSEQRNQSDQNEPVFSANERYIDDFLMDSLLIEMKNCHEKT